MSEIKANRELSGRNLFLLCALLVGGGACLIFSGDILNGYDLYFKVIRDPNPFVAAYPWYHHHHEALLQGRFPLWIPFNGMGAPLIANYQSGFFSPLLAPLFIFPINLIASPYLLLRLVLAGLGTALYLRRLGLGPHSCAIGATAFGLSGWMIQYFNNQHLVIDMLIPFILLFLEKLSAEKKLRDALALLALLALVLVGGQPGSALFTILFTGAYTAFLAVREKNAIIIFACMGAASVLLSLVQLFPFFELMSQGWSAHLPDWSLLHLRLSEIITLIAPGFYGFTNDNRIPIMQQLPYLGVVPALLCLMAVFNFRSAPRQGRFFIIGIFVCIGFLHGLPGFHQLMSMPGLSLISFSKYLQPLLTFSAAVCAALAIERIKNPNRHIILMSSFIILFLIWQGNRFPEAWIFPAASAGLVIIQLAAFKIFFNRKWALVLLALIGLIIDSRFNRPNFFFNPEKHDFTFLKPFAGRPPHFFRIAATHDVFAPNYGVLEGVSDLRLCEVLFVRRHIEYLMALNELTQDQMREHILPYSHTAIRPEEKYFRGNLASRAGLRWFLSRNPLPPNRSIQKILKTGLVMAPGPDHLLKSQFELSGDSRKVLFQHPPSIISAAPPGAISPVLARAALAFDPEAWNLPGDGAWFVCENDDSLLYSRYIDPKIREDERRWVPLEIHEPSISSLRLVTLPGNDPHNDWAGWGDLRIGEDPALEAGIYKGYRVYENETAIPRASFAAGVRWVPDSASSKSLLASQGPDESAVLMEGSGPEKIHGYSHGEVKQISINPDALHLELDAEGDAALVVNQTYFPGWQARLDNNEVRILPADHAFQGIPVPEGRHKLDLEYRPIAFRTGLWTSIVSLVFWLAIWRPRFFREA